MLPTWPKKRPISHPVVNSLAGTILVLVEARRESAARTTQDRAGNGRQISTVSELSAEFFGGATMACSSRA